MLFYSFNKSVWIKSVIKVACYFSFKLKAVLKCPLTEANFSNTLLKLIFLTKVPEIWMRDYWSENTSNNVFHCSVSVIEFEFQLIGFLASCFFVTFIRKLTQMRILTVFSRILDGLTEKRRTQFDFML